MLQERRPERAEATAAALRDELGRAHAEVDRIRQETADALATARADAETRHREALDGATARYAGEVAGLTAPARGRPGGRPGQARRDELTRAREEIQALLTALRAEPGTTDATEERAPQRRRRRPPAAE